MVGWWRSGVAHSQCAPGGVTWSVTWSVTQPSYERHVGVMRASLRRHGRESGRVAVGAWPRDGTSGCRLASCIGGAKLLTTAAEASAWWVRARVPLAAAGRFGSRARMELVAVPGRATVAGGTAAQELGGGGAGSTRRGRPG